MLKKGKAAILQKALLFFPASVKKAIKNYDEKLFLFSPFFCFSRQSYKRNFVFEKGEIRMP